MEPLGLLGALLGGYQQGRLTKQNRSIKSAQLLRQQQENEALQKYRSDSLDLQRKRIENVEPPQNKIIRDLFSGSLKGFNDDFNKEVQVAHARNQTADGLSTAMNGIYNKYNSMYKGLRQQHASSPVLGELGTFEDVSGPSVPDWVRSEKFDASRYPRPYFDADRFQGDMNKAVEDMTLRGITEPDAQYDFLNARVLSDSQLYGISPEELWKAVPYTQPGSPMQGKSLSVETSPPVQTNVIDPNIPAFGSQEDPSGNSTTTYTHSTPQNFQSLPDFKNSGPQGLQATGSNYNQDNYVAPTSDALAHEMMVDDLHHMFKDPNLRRQFGLTDVSNANEFKKAIQIYMSPMGQQALQNSYNISENFGRNSNTGQQNEFYDPRPYGNFASSAQGQKISDQFKNAPLKAQTSRIVETPFTQKYAIPLTDKDRQRKAQIDLTVARLPTLIASGELMANKLEIQNATKLDQISAPALKNMLSAMRLTLEPAKYLLSKAKFDLDKYDKEYDNFINYGKLTLENKKFLVDDAARATRTLLQSSDANLKQASLGLSFAFKDQILTTGIFEADIAIKEKIKNNLELTADEMAKVRASIPLQTDDRVKKAIEVYDAALKERDIAYKAQKAFADLGGSFSNIQPSVSTVVPGQSTDPYADIDGGFPDPETVKPATTVVKPPTVNIRGVTVDGAGRTPRQNAQDAVKTAIPTVAITPRITSKVSTPPGIISKAQEKLRSKTETPVPKVTPKKGQVRNQTNVPKYTQSSY